MPTAESDIDIVKQAFAEELAVDVLWSLSGRQFGICPVIARPCPQTFPLRMYDPFSALPFYPIWDGGQWRNVTCGCTGHCDWRAPSVIHLPTMAGQPVREVIEVKIGSTVLDPSGYTLEGDLLYRTGGVAWPDQDLTLPLDVDGTWSVEYTRGNPVPAGVGVFTGLLAKEFYNACSGGACRIDRKIRTTTRGGSNVAVVDPTDIYRTGKTGLPEIDQWLAAVNPHHVMSAPKVR